MAPTPRATDSSLMTTCDSSCVRFGDWPFREEQSDQSGSAAGWRADSGGGMHSAIDVLRRRDLCTPSWV